MTDRSTDESAPAPQGPPQKHDELSDQQLEGVAGAAGRQVQDCEGHAYLTTAVLGTSGKNTALKSE